jgi:hypothetical protein
MKMVSLRDVSPDGYQQIALNLVPSAVLESLLKNRPLGGARLDSSQVAKFLGLPVNGIPILDRKGLLQHLGKPKKNAAKFYAAVDVARAALDPKWLGEATELISRHWRDKNQLKRKRLVAAA